jgi:hypothetical protein
MGVQHIGYEQMEFHFHFPCQFMAQCLNTIITSTISLLNLVSFNDDLSLLMLFSVKCYGNVLSVNWKICGINSIN